MNLPKGVFIMGNVVDASAQPISGHVPSAGSGDREKA
jgi:hypothetical protein